MLFIRKVTIPINICGHTAGDRVPFMDLMVDIDVFVSKILQENAELTDENSALADDLDEALRTIDDLQEEVDQMQAVLYETKSRTKYYQEYYDHGVSPCDF